VYGISSRPLISASAGEKKLGKDVKLIPKTEKSGVCKRLQATRGGSEENQQYMPSKGSVHYKQIDKAIKEFKRQIETQEDVRILVAKGISIKRWLDSTMEDRVPYVYF
jgi:hypothetical protein